MLDYEFNSRLPEGVRKPTAEEFEVISLVYGYHPCISQGYDGKDQIAMLYSTFGMRIILDMQETAKRSEEIQSREWQLKKELSELDSELDELKRGAVK